MSNPVLRLNTSQETRYDFDVSVSGLDSSQPQVRFVVRGPDYDISVPCSRTEDGQWGVCVPPVPFTSSDGFSVEVIVDGYHFEPVKGSVELVSTPTVSMQAPSFARQETRPSVSATFTEAKEEIAPVIQPAEKKLRLAESLDAEERGDLTRTLTGTASVLSKTAKVLETMAGREQLSTMALNEAISTARKAIGLVEVKIFL